MAESSEHFEHTKVIYGLEENILPKGDMHKDSQTLPDFSVMRGVESSILTEDYGRNCVYDVLYKDKTLQVERTVAMNENEAWSLLISALSCISSPLVKEIPNLGNKAFGIDDSFVLFVKNNVLIGVSAEGGNAMDFARELEKTI